jgi:hypothetical protein
LAQGRRTPRRNATFSNPAIFGAKKCHLVPFGASAFGARWRTLQTRNPAPSLPPRTQRPSHHASLVTRNLAWSFFYQPETCSILLHFAPKCSIPL